jgi:WD40 repeat protein
VLLVGGGVILAQIIIRIKHKDGKVTEIPVAKGDKVEIIKPPPEPLGAGTWKLGPAENVLAGFIPRPMQLPGGQRWQIETAGPRSEVHAVAWSPDGKLLAVGSETGEVRLYDSRTQ